MELGVDRAGGLLWHPGDSLELLLGRREEALGRAEVLKERASPGRAHALERVEDRLLRLRVAPLPVEAEREAVRLVTDPLEQLEPGRMPVEDDRLGTVGNEDLPADLVDAAVAIAPGIESPTISPLRDPDWVAVRVMSPRKGVNQVMDALYAIGARAILVTEIHAARL